MIPAAEPPPPPPSGTDYRCTQCGKKFFVAYLPVGAWIEIYCFRCRHRNIIRGTAGWSPTPLT